MKFLVAEFAYPALAGGDCHLGKVLLVLDHIIYPLLEGVLGDETMHHNVLVLADAIGTVRGLCLHGRVPPKVEMDHVQAAVRFRPVPAAFNDRMNILSSFPF